jgi:hypothetical protein
VDVEIPTCVVIAIMLVMVCGVHLGRAIANVVAGADWVFPERAEMFRSLPAVLQGDAGGWHSWPRRDRRVIDSGLDVYGGDGADPSDCLRGAPQDGSGSLGSGADEGHGESAEAERLLGVARVRRVRAVIRPDLYGNRRSEQQNDHETG